MLLHPQTVPADWLDWLASWFDLALDPMWDEARRRLFLANAMQFFAARGTMRGVEIALRFVLDTCVDASVYTDTRPPALATARIVESFRTRQTPGVVFGDPTDLEPLRLVTTAAAWRPDQGGDALAAGYAAYPRRHRGSTRPRTRSPTRAATRARRGSSSRRPRSASSRRSPTRRRGRTSCRAGTRITGAVATAYGSASAPADFTGVDPPLTLPADGPALLDWFQFQSVVLPMRRKAHRFTVLLPWPMHVLDSSGAELDHVRLRDLATRIVDAAEAGAHDLRRQVLLGGVPHRRGAPRRRHAARERQPRSRARRAAVLGRDYVGTTTLAGPVAGDAIVRNAARTTFHFSNGHRRGGAMTSFAPSALPQVAPPDPTKHVNYSLGMVLGVDDFTQEFAYLSGHDNRVVRDLIGYGVVAGLHVTVDVDADRGPRVQVAPGEAVTPSGRLVCVVAGAVRVSQRLARGEPAGTSRRSARRRRRRCRSPSSPATGSARPTTCRSRASRA